MNPAPKQVEMPRYPSFQVTWTYNQNAPDEVKLMVAWRTANGGTHSEPVKCLEDLDDIPPKVRQGIKEKFALLFAD